MTKIYTLDQIKEVIQTLDLSGTIEEGFMAYSKGEVVVPPVGELVFDTPPGDTHIKYGYIKNTSFYVIKIASGFYENPEIGLPSSSGLMLVFSQKTGIPQAILLDEGYLTNVRTAVAGQIAATYFAPSTVRAIGILGTGIQARMQVAWLSSVTPCKKLYVWGRTPRNLEIYKQEMDAKGYEVTLVNTPADVATAANLIVTTTPSQRPLLQAADIRPGTHITAMGSDTPQKQELDSNILRKADLIVADSLSQCRDRGEISRALAAGCITENKLQELGQVIGSSTPARTSDNQISVVDLTGVAVQDIQIATAVYKALTKTNHGGNPS